MEFRAGYGIRRKSEVRKLLTCGQLVFPVWIKSFHLSQSIISLQYSIHLTQISLFLILINYFNITYTGTEYRYRCYGSIVNKQSIVIVILFPQIMLYYSKNIVLFIWILWKVYIRCQIYFKMISLINLLSPPGLGYEAAPFLDAKHHLTNI